MDYPAIPFVLESSDRRADPVLLSTARSGAPKARRLYDRQRRRFRIVHRGLSDAQKAVLDSFLATARLTPFVIYWPCRVGGVAYSVIEDSGENDWKKSDGLWSTEIGVLEV